MFENESPKCEENDIGIVGEIDEDEGDMRIESIWPKRDDREKRVILLECP